MPKKNEIELEVNYNDLADEVLKEMGLDQEDEDKEEEEVELDEDEKNEDEENEDEENEDEDEDEDLEEFEEEDEDLDEDEEEEEEEDSEDQNHNDDGDESYKPKPKGLDKAAHAFQELRNKTKTYEEKLKNLDDIAQRYGFKDSSELVSSLEKDSIKKIAEKQGVDPKMYAELENTKKRLEVLERENKAKEEQLVLNKFLTELDSFSKEMGLSLDEKQSIIKKWMMMAILLIC
jgi:hypothetical protein